jgi:hypothetical protein
LPEHYFLWCRFGFNLKTLNIVDIVNTMIIEIDVNIGPTVNTVHSARRRLVNFGNAAKTLNSGPLYCEFCVCDKKSSTSAVWFQFL